MVVFLVCRPPLSLLCQQLPSLPAPAPQSWWCPACCLCPLGPLLPTGWPRGVAMWPLCPQYLAASSLCSLPVGVMWPRGGGSGETPGPACGHTAPMAPTGPPFLTTQAPTPSVSAPDHQPSDQSEEQEIERLAGSSLPGAPRRDGVAIQDVALPPRAHRDGPVLRPEVQFQG